MVEIRKVGNGYILKNEHGFETIYTTSEGLFNELLLKFEGKSKSFKGINFGYVRVITDKNDKKNLICESMNKQNRINELENHIDKLQAFIDDVVPFLRRLREPRYDENETNDYICNSSDCSRALKALDEYEGS